MYLFTFEKLLNNFTLTSQNLDKDTVKAAYDTINTLYEGDPDEIYALIATNASKQTGKTVTAKNVQNIYEGVIQAKNYGLSDQDAYNLVSAKTLGIVSAEEVEQIYTNVNAALACKGDLNQSIAFVAASSGQDPEDVRALYNGVQGLVDGYSVEQACKAVADAANVEPASVQAAYKNVDFLTNTQSEADAVAYVAKNSGQKTEDIQSLYTMMNLLQQGLTKEQAYAVMKAATPGLTDAQIDQALATDLSESEKLLAAANNTINESQKKLDAAEPQLAAAKTQLEEAAAKLAKGKAQLDEYEAGKAKLDAAKPQLEAAKKQLEEAKKTLDAGLEKLKTFEEGEKQIEAGKATLTAIEAVKAKVDAGMDVVSAGYSYLDDSTVSTTKDLTGKAVANILALIAGVLGIIAGILGLAGKKATRTFAALAVIAAAAAVIFAIIKDPIVAVLIASICGTAATLALTMVAKPAAAANTAVEDSTDAGNE